MGRMGRIGRMGLLAVCLAAGFAASGAKEVRHQVMANGYYAREVRDQDWHVRIVGEIPSLCGAYLLIHDAKSRVIHHGVVPHGKYPSGKPFVVTVKKDGVVGDYKIIMVGHQRDKLGVTVPWTDLPYEAYGGSSFSIGHDLNIKPFFKPPPGVKKMHLGAYKGHLRVLDAKGKVVADTYTQGRKHGRYDNAVEFKVKPGATYTIERKCFYFRSYIPGTLFLAFERGRSFAPSPELDKVKWWELVK